MNIVTGVFDTVGDAETAVKALLDAHFSDDDIGIVTRDRNKGSVVADDLGRDYTGGMTPQRGVITSRSYVYDRLPDAFVTNIREARLPGDPVKWYNEQLDQGMILLVVNAGDRMDEAARTITDHGGKLYQPAQQPTPQPAAVPPPTPAPQPAAATTTPPPAQPTVPPPAPAQAASTIPTQPTEMRVVEEPGTRLVEVPASVMHEEVRVERRQLDRPLRPDEYGGVKTEGNVVRVPIVEEEVHVIKEPMVREELVITRVPVTEQRTMRESVQRVEPRVEPAQPPPEEKRRPAA